jgi:hypothetical protein
VLSLSRMPLPRLSSNVIKNHKGYIPSVPGRQYCRVSSVPQFSEQKKQPSSHCLPSLCTYLGPFIANKRLVICTMILTSSPAALTGAKICKNSIGLLGLTSVLM